MLLPGSAPPAPARTSSSDALPEASAGLLPLALRAPQLPVLHSVHLAALLGLAARPPYRRLGRVGAVRLGRQSDVLARRLKQIQG